MAQASEVVGISVDCAAGARPDHRRRSRTLDRDEDDPRPVGRAGPARPRRRAQRVLRAAVGPRRHRRAGRAGREQAPLALRLRAHRRHADQGQRPGRRGLRGGDLPLAPQERGRAVADRHQPGPVPALAVADRLAGRRTRPTCAPGGSRTARSTRSRSRSHERRRRDAGLPVVRASPPARRALLRRLRDAADLHGRRRGPGRGRAPPTSAPARSTRASPRASWCAWPAAATRPRPR